METKIKGLKLIDLTMHADDRGVFTEVFRQSWVEEIRPVQWNVVRSNENVLRGVHFHIKHDDYLTIAEGEAVFGLKDLRPTSPTEGKVEMIKISSEDMKALAIPHGVAHGFFFTKPSIHVYAVSEYWDMADEHGCRFDDTDLAMPWPEKNPHISDRDRDLPALKDVIGKVPPYEGS